MSGGGGGSLEADVSWPDVGRPPPAGWSVVFWAHGAGGSKNSNAGNARDFADCGYLSLTYTNHPEEDRNPTNFANDLIAIKAWPVNDFETKTNVTAPVDPASFSMSGNSLGGLTTWSAILLTNEFGAAVPRTWSIHALPDHFSTNRSIERQTAAAPALLQFPTLEYPRAQADVFLEASANPLLCGFQTLTIPVGHARQPHLGPGRLDERLAAHGLPGHRRTPDCQ